MKTRRKILRRGRPAVRSLTLAEQRLLRRAVRATMVEEAFTNGLDDVGYRFQEIIPGMLDEPGPYEDAIDNYCHKIILEERARVAEAPCGGQP
jgi:hypothetical protein